MKYYICEGTPSGEYNASTKARRDAEEIMSRLGYEKYYIHTKYGVEVNKIKKVKQLITYQRNKKIWQTGLETMKAGDMIVVQYPLINVTIGYEEIIRFYRERGIIIIALIHDLDSLRYTPQAQGRMQYSRVKKEDVSILQECSYIIAHNAEMKKALIAMGIAEEKIFELHIFDYLASQENCKIERNKNMLVVIAGNLNKEKAKYLEYLSTIQQVDFNLFGVGFQPNDKEKNIYYQGAFLPEELLEHLQGGFGLIWDGMSKETCKGGFGDYLRYNNPHKTSLYLAAALPVIVWSQSAMAKFVIEEKVGIVIDSLDDISKKVAALSTQDYVKLLQNCAEVSEKIRKGAYLSEVLRRIERVEKGEKS